MPPITFIAFCIRHKKIVLSFQTSASATRDGDGAKAWKQGTILPIARVAFMPELLHTSCAGVKPGFFSWNSHLILIFLRPNRRIILA